MCVCVWLCLDATAQPGCSMPSGCRCVLVQRQLGFQAGMCVWLRAWLRACMCDIMTDTHLDPLTPHCVTRPADGRGSGHGRGDDLSAQLACAHARRRDAVSHRRGQGVYNASCSLHGCVAPLTILWVWWWVYQARELLTQAVTLMPDGYTEVFNMGKFMECVTPSPPLCCVVGFSLPLVCLTLALVACVTCACAAECMRRTMPLPSCTWNEPRRCGRPKR